MMSLHSKVDADESRDSMLHARGGAVKVSDRVREATGAADGPDGGEGAAASSPDRRSPCSGWERLSRDLGLDGIVREEVGGGAWYDDKRGAPFVNEKVLGRLGPVVAELARGHVGLLGATGVTDATKVHAIAVGSPLLLAILDGEKDGAGEVLLADLAIANHVLAGVVTHQLQEALVQGGRTIERTRLLCQLHGSLTRGMERALVNLQRFRAFRRAEAGELEVKIKALGSQETTDAEIDAPH
jgi:hypothetical protein